MGTMGNCWSWGILACLMLTAAIPAGVVADETEVVYLSGHGKDDAVPWEFFCTGGRKSGRWTTIGVPSNWELQGFGAYNYGHDRNKADEQGKYRRTFIAPQGWTDKRVFIVFEGVMTDTEVWVNGRSAGPRHQGGFYRFKYEITDLVKAGENLLEVTVSKVSSDRSVEAAERRADYWVFGGIYRPVYLEVVPKEFIEHVAIDAHVDGTFRADVHVQGVVSADVVEVKIIGPARQGRGRSRNRTGAAEIQPEELLVFMLSQALGPSAVASIEPGQEVVTVQMGIERHKTWTAETPHVYRAEVRLLRGREVIHTVTQRFGFRTFEVRAGDGLYLNGQKIRLKGVCRHSFWPDSGRCLSRAVSYADVRLIKEMNMNAVRMSHYPPDTHFLEACDELGLYVLDELAGWQRPPYSTDIGKKLVKELVTRDVCHPCILFWDNANEGGWNRELDEEFALYDPQKRTVLHPWESFGGIDTDHYESYESTQRKLSGSTLFMPTEFLHGLYDGGHGAGLNDYWDLMVASPLGAGGFLWALVDEGVVRTDKGGRIDVSGNQAPDGILGPYREREGSFYTIKEIWSPVHIDLDELPAEFDGVLKVENRYDFTNLRDCVFEVKLADFPSPWEDAVGHTAFFKRGSGGPDVEPHSKGTFDLGLPADWRDADVLYLSAYDRDRREIWTWSWDLRPENYYRKRYFRRRTDDTERATAVLQGGELHVRASDTDLRFSATTGALIGVRNGDREFSLRGPQLVGGQLQMTRMVWSQVKDMIAVTADYGGDMNHVSWWVYPSGWICLDYQYVWEGPFEHFGVDLLYPEGKMRAMRWLGEGPYRVWKNRLKGGKLDVWRNDCKEHVPGRTWDFPEFKGYYKDWRWVVFETEEGRITIVNGTKDVFLGVYRPDDGPDPRNTRLEVPWHGIAFLHGIPAIGTKFQKPEALGPESQKNQASGTYRGTLWFYFGDS